MNLNNKKVLFLCQRFFGYEDAICKKIKSFGADVDFFDERPSNSVIGKIIIRLNLPFLCKWFAHRYYKSILEKIKGVKKYDYFFVVKIESLTEAILTEVKYRYPNAIFILYLWDSIDNYKHKLGTLKYFDRIFSFDVDDSLKYRQIMFKPLFFLDHYSDLSKTKKTVEYDLVFVGSGHGDRLFFLKQLVTLNKASNFSYYFFVYFQSRIHFVIRRLFDPRMRGIKTSDVCFKSLDSIELRSILEKSRAVIDIEHIKQKGLTIRSIEMLGAKIKLVTTNQAVKNYDFYNSNNICVIDRKNPVIPKVFLQSEYSDVPNSIREKYSLDNWVRGIFEI